MPDVINSRRKHREALNRYDAFLRTGDPSALDEAIGLFRQAIDLRPAGQEDSATNLAALSAALGTRFNVRGDLSDLDAAVDLARGATESAPQGDQRFRANLGTALLARATATGVSADLDEAITLLERAAGTGLPGRERYLANLGLALLSRYESTGSTAALHAAVGNLREAVVLLDPGDPERDAYLSNLGTAVTWRFQLTGEPSDLDEAIQLGRQAVAATPYGHPRQARYLVNLATALLARADWTDEPTDRDTAIRLLTEAAQATSPDDPDRARYLSNLGAALTARFERTGNIDDLHEAIAAGEQAVEAVQIAGNDPSAQATYLANLGAILQRLVRLLPNQGELAGAEVLVLHERVLQMRRRLLGDDHPDTLASMNNLAVVLQELGQFRDARELNERALRARERILGPDHPDTLGSVHNLAMVLEMVGEHQAARNLLARVPGREVAVAEPISGADSATAAAAYREAADRGDTSALRALASMLERSGDTEGAIAAYRQAADRGDIGALSALANLLHQRGDDEAAASAYRLAADRGGTDALRTLAGLLLNRGDVDAAVATYRRAADSGDRHALRTLGDLWQRRGDDDAAAGAYREAADHGDEDALWALADLMQRRGDSAAAEAVLHRAENSAEQPRETKVDIVILTAADVDESAMGSALEGVHTEQWRGRRVHRGTRKGWRLLVAGGPWTGRIATAQSAFEIITARRPVYLFLIGSARPVDDRVPLGDVLVPDPIVGHDPLTGHRETYHPDLQLVRLARAAARTGKPRAHVLPVLTTDGATTGRQPAPRSVAAVDESSSGLVRVASGTGARFLMIEATSGVEAAIQFAARVVDQLGPRVGERDSDPPPQTFSGRTKLLVVRRLGPEWRHAADLLGVPVPAIARFDVGEEARALWDWLEERGRLDELAEVLSLIGREDLRELLRPEPR